MRRCSLLSLLLCAPSSCISAQLVPRPSTSIPGAAATSVVLCCKRRHKLPPDTYHKRVWLHSCSKAIASARLYLGMVCYRARATCGSRILGLYWRLLLAGWLQLRCAQVDVLCLWSGKRAECSLHNDIVGCPLILQITDESAHSRLF